MKASIASNLMKSGAATLLFGVIALTSYAGPGPQFWNHTTPVTTVKEAATIKPDDTVVMVCGACKTTMIRDSKHVGPSDKGRDEWFAIGYNHQCGHCGDEIAVAKGKTADAMQFNCTVCGANAASCCGTTHEDGKK
jgi:hypothetical protein